MTKKFFLKLASLCILIFVASCRQESILQENANQKFDKNYKVYTLNKNQITSDFTLFGSVAKVQETFSKRNMNSKSVQDSILDGGIIGINKVLVVEDDNGKKTYTFPLKRTFVSNKIENLVLTKNTDSTFSGYLVQYNISEQEKELFNNWHSIDLKSKIKITNIKKLHINTSANAKPKSETTDDGCITVNYDDGKCASGLHSYGQKCDYDGKAGAPTQPHVLSIVYNDCFGGGGGNGGSFGNGSTGGTGSSGGIGGGDGGTSNSGGGADTMPFSDANFNYYNSLDMADPAFQFYSQVSQFIQTQPKNVRDLNMLNQYIFYFTHNYFSIHGMDNTTKSFVAQRLQLIANWFYNINFNNSTFPNPSQKELFATRALNYMLNHKPDAYNYFFNSIADLDLLFMYITNNNSTNFANSTADTILNILLENYQNGIFNNDNKQKFFHGLSQYYTENNGSLDAQNFVTWALQFKKENPETSWSEFKNWFINNDNTTNITFDSNINSTNGIVFNFKQFKNYLINSNSNFQQMKKASDNFGVTDIKYDVPGVFGGLNLLLDHNKVNNKYIAESVNISQYGIALTWSFSTTKTKTINENNINYFIIWGTLHHNIFIENIGTIYHSNRIITIKTLPLDGSAYFFSDIKN